MNEVKCNVCGEMNLTDATFCASCGAPSISTNKLDATENAVERRKDHSAKSKSSEKNKRQKNANQKNVETKPKEVSKTKLFYLLFVLILVGGLILYASGVFDQPVVTQTQDFSNSNNNNPHAGVDLSSLEQINTLEEKVKNDPNNKELELQLAHLLNDSGLKTRAIEEYQKYLKMDPKDADVWVDMGVCYYETGKNQEAINSMERAIKIQPKHQIGNLNLGIVNMAAGNRAIAIKYLQRAIEIDSTNEIGQKAKDLIKSH